MNKLKKILLLVLTATFINIPFSSVCTAKNTEYVGNVTYKLRVNTVTASVEVSAENKKRILVLAGYKDGCLVKISGDSQVVDGTKTLTTSIDNTDTDEIIATVIDSFGGGVLSRRAVWGADSVSLESIKVNGEALEYDDETDEYWYQYSKEPVVIDAKVKDGTTKMTISDYNAPCDAKIELVSSSGKKRNIVVHLYKSEEELSKLNRISYKIGEDVYEIKDFNPNNTKYTVELADNTMGVTLLPEAMGDVSCTISNECVTTLNNVSLGSMYSTGSTAYEYAHNARKNYIPIKNEKTTAYVTVKTGDTENKYQFDFVCKQPRLTSFEYVGATNDSSSHKPVFIGGSAVNNDYGTILCQDRMWALGNISKELLGGSMFMFAGENKNSGTWWSSNTSGEYFNFTADTAGTVYILSGNTISNSEYNSWTKGTSAVTLPDSYSWVTTPKDWNDYADKCFACVMEHQNNYNRAINPWIAENEGDDTMLYPIEMKYYAYKSFTAGEKVSIYHTGKTGQNAAKSMVVIKWDGVTIPEDDEEGEEETEQKEVPYDKIEDENMVMSVVFDEDTETSDNKWLDRSGHHNDITLNIDTDNKWTDKGFLAKGASTTQTQLPTAVKDAIDSNKFTLQFELAELNPESGKKCGILSSADGNFELYKSNSNDKVYFKWAGITMATKMPYVMLEQMVGHLNTIVVDKTTSTITWYIDGQTGLTDTKMTVTMTATNKTVDKVVFSNSNSAYGGNAVFKSLKVYNKALSLTEITGGGTK